MAQAGEILVNVHVDGKAVAKAVAAADRVGKPVDKQVPDNDVEVAAVLQTEGRMLAVRPEMLPTLAAMHGRIITLDDVEETKKAAARGRAAQVQGGVGIVNLKGMITPEPSLLALIFGLGGGLSTFMSEMRSMVADPDVSTIVINTDSPGGYVDGVPEAAAEIRGMREHKQIVSISNTTMASAAYWLASQAHEVVITPSGEAGSIGVYQLHQDVSGALAQSGIKPTLVSAGRYKVEGNPFQPLDGEAAQFMQSQVDDYYDMFTKDVAAGRGVTQDQVKEGYGEGRALTARRAVRAGIADKVATLGDTVSRFSSGRGRARRAEGDDQQVMSSDDRRRLVDALAG